MKGPDVLWGVRTKDLNGAGLAGRSQAVAPPEGLHDGLLAVTSDVLERISFLQVLRTAILS